MARDLQISPSTKRSEIRPAETRQPDTEVSQPLTPLPPTESLSESVRIDESDAFGEKAAITRASLIARSRDTLPESERFLGPENIPHGADHHEGFTPVPARISRPNSTETGAGHHSGNSNTTLQSLMRPEISPSSMSHTRRFLHIECDLDQCNAAIKLLEKRLAKAQLRSRVTLGLAALALLLALSRFSP